MKRPLLLLIITTQIVLFADDTFRVEGQIVAESAWFENATGESTNDQAIRRARISLKAKPTDALKYEVEYSFTGNNHWKDVYLECKFFDNFFVKAGNIKEPIGLEALTSSKYNTFMERALGQAFMNKRKLGVQVHYPLKYNHQRYTFTAGAFGQSLDEVIDDEEAGNSLVARVTYAYIPTKTTLLHLGAAISGTDYNQQNITLNTRPESDLFDRKLISTKIKDVESTQRMGIESAMVWHNLALQGEYFYMHVDNIDTDYAFDSWYLQASWFMTGECKRYKAKNATFSRVKPLSPVTDGGWGAWEVALRMSYLDIDDKDEVESKERDYTLGINWYATSHFRVMTNYVHADLTEPDLPSEEIVQARVQYDF